MGMCPDVILGVTMIALTWTLTDPGPYANRDAKPLRLIPTLTVQNLTATLAFALTLTIIRR